MTDVKRFCVLLVMVGLVFICPKGVFSESLEITEPFSPSATKYEIEGLTAAIHSEGTVLIITGKVKNISHGVLKGHAVVYFRDKNKDDLGYAETDVNGNHPFLHGESGAFETAVRVSEKSNINSIAVEFVEH
jgi:hypothetical protein